jgi:hypothetical protein
MTTEQQIAADLDLCDIGMNAFRCTPDHSLDRLYLRTCAIYRLLKSNRIGYTQAIELQNLPIKGCYKQQNHLRSTIQIWRSGPLKGMLP